MNVNSNLPIIAWKTIHVLIQLDRTHVIGSVEKKNEKILEFVIIFFVFYSRLNRPCPDCGVCGDNAYCVVADDGSTHCKCVPGYEGGAYAGLVRIKIITILINVIFYL